MSKPFEPFISELNWQQVSLLLDTVLYFEDALKLLSIPSVAGERIAVPLSADTLREVLEQLDEEQPFESKGFAFDFEWIDQAKQRGVVHVTLPTNSQVTQETVLTEFSAV